MVFVSANANPNTLSSVFQSIFAPFLTLELGYMGLHKYFPKVCYFCVINLSLSKGGPYEGMVTFPGCSTFNSIVIRCMSE